MCKLESSCGSLILLNPAYSETPAPIANIKIATTNVQKYSSMPYPNGCLSSAGREDRLRPQSTKIWLLVSTMECTASLSMAALPVIAEAIAFVAAIRALAIMAASTTHVLPVFGFNRMNQEGIIPYRVKQVVRLACIHVNWQEKPGSISL